MAEELGLFSFGDVVQHITAKMIRRHPHVFGQSGETTSAAVKETWAAIKQREKQARAAQRGDATHDQGDDFFKDVAIALPALTRAVKLQSRASKVGFDWNDARKVLEKMKEETIEIETALACGDKAEIENEIGDLLFTVANLARHLEIDPETAARGANAKFVRRFSFIAHELAVKGKTLDEADLEEMDALWDAAKEDEAKSGAS
jgi:ATP diphosphatase